jgi:hypothetical protein
MAGGGTSTTTPSSTPTWRVIITDWALDSYLAHKHAQTFTDQEYWTVIRPDVERLRGGIPSPDPKFTNSGFWGPAKVGNVVLPHGYKMKWHNIGPGQVQLRLPVMIGSAQAFLCEAYVKANAAVDKRKMARFKTHMNLIALGRYVYRGDL